MHKWISRKTVLGIHDEQLAEHGGPPGIRDDNALESAIAKPQQLEAYGDPPPDLADLAAAYAFGLACNHAFVDGNKRTSLLVTVTFLDLNGHPLDADLAEVYKTWVRLADGQMTQDALADWIRANIT